MTHRRVRTPSTSKLSDASSYLKYLKPGALAKLRDSKINLRSHRLNSQSQISLHRAQPASSLPAQNTSDDSPCFTGSIYGPQFPRRKKLVATKYFFLPPASPVSDSPDPIIDLFGTDLLVAH